jgi:predicted GNAT family N-acyltransferase
MLKPAASALVDGVRMADTALAVLTVPVFSMLCNEGFRLRRMVFIVEQNFRLRRMVFIVKQKVPEDEEFDAHDLAATHVVAVAGGEVCGTLRVIHDPEHIKIGRVVVAIPARGRGVASAMIAHAIALQPQGSRFNLTTQTDKTSLYEKFGFASFGDIFDDGGMPHIAMKTY